VLFRSLGETIPPALAALTMACLAKQPKDRPASMGAIEAALLSDESGLSRRVGMLVVGLAAVAVGAGLVLAFKPKPEVVPAPVAVEAPPPPPPVLEAPVAVSEITLAVDTHPSGAKLTRRDTGEVLGTTPFERKLAKADLLPLRIELPGHQALERELKLDQSQRLDITL
jgi:serine/threonine-protein kinase